MGFWNQMEAILAGTWAPRFLGTLAGLAVGLDYMSASDLNGPCSSYCICMCFSHKPHQQTLLWSPENASWGEEPPQEKALTLSPHSMTPQRCLWGLIYTTSKVQYSETTRCWPKLSAWSRCSGTSVAKTICARSLWQWWNNCPHRNNCSTPD